MRLLADTGALLALVLDDDQNHQAARSFLRNAGRERFVLTELILSEFATRLRAATDAHTAGRFARDLLRSERYELILADEDLLAAGIGRMEQFADKRLSLTDCVSFELIDRLGLDGAFSFDRDFRDCGYRMLP